jgi:site-specific recombinase XerD
MTEPCRVRVTGPLAPYSAGLWQELRSQGYTPASAEMQARLLARLSGWLEEEGIPAEGLSPEVGQRFLEARRAAGYKSFVSSRSLTLALAHLRDRGVVPEPVAVSASPAVDELLARYADYLAHERGLSSGTIAYYTELARPFLAERPDPLLESLGQLTAGQVTEHVVRGCATRSVDPAKRLTSSMRSLLRFLLAKGLANVEPTSAVPTVAGWRRALPPVLEPTSVAALFESCDRTTLVGCRDLAILLMLARLGLRAGEVAALSLDDVAWRQGELMVPRGKTRRRDRMPLPDDVGAALAEYLHRLHDRGECRRVFLRVVAPLHGLTSHGVQQVVRHACERAGLPGLGAHRLRHFAATEVLRKGGGLGEVAQLLRHRSISTTAAYAKVDRDRLRPLALPWPGGAA